MQNIYTHTYINREGERGRGSGRGREREGGREGTRGWGGRERE
jgi:hypothetical protein